MDSAEDLFAEALRVQPSWQEDPDDDDPSVQQRYAQAVHLFTLSAQQGHPQALKLLAQGMAGSESIKWAIQLAKEHGDGSALNSLLTDGRDDTPPAALKGVLESARQGEPWAQLAVGNVYGLGMQDTNTGEAIAKKEMSYGWMPGVQDPEAESEKWINLAAEAGWPAALIAVAQNEKRRDPKRALELLKRIPEDAEGLDSKYKKLVGKWTAQLLQETGAPLPDIIAQHEKLVNEYNDDDSCAWLGDLYRRGSDSDGKVAVEIDLDKARSYYSKGVELGSVDSMRELAKMLELEGEDERAQELYENAAELAGDGYSRDRLAEKYGLEWYARTEEEKMEDDY